MRFMWVLLWVLASAALAGGKAYPLRWVFVSRGLHKDQDVEDIRGIVRTAAKHGLNGMVLSGGLDRIALQPDHYFQRLEAVKALCREHKIEIIPIIFSAGYGGSVLAHDRNLAAGIPVRDALYVVRGRTATLAPDPPPTLVNGGFEDHKGHRVTGYRFHDLPGTISFVDTQIAHGGKASLRFQDFQKDRHLHGRVMQEVAVRPRRCYRVSVWVKTHGLAPEGRFKVQVLAGKRSLAPVQPVVPATGDWRKIALGFNSLEFDRVRVYAGTWGARKGRFWVDDLRIEEVGLLNVLRRPGTPVAVRGEASGTVYEEGRDYAPIADPKLTFRFDRESLPIRLLPQSRIVSGERLRVHYYHGVSIHRSQVTACMSEPKLYDIWRAQARLIHKHLAPARYLLSMDEIRAGGSCVACKERGLTMGEILGDCITRQHKMIREVNPQAEIWTWSDMLDPNHNAHGDYYLVEGNFTGSWRHVPKDLGIVCWYFAKRGESLPFFSKLGFRTLAGAYYDGDTLDNPREWLDVLDATPNAVGIMYTTWRNRYELLGPFGDLVSKRR
ncbi:hypothetical protein HQ560_14595 [bacterium]|nr:hypothetical protein [bacterium]